MSTLAEASRSGLAVVGQSVERGRERSRTARHLSHEARDVLGTASLAAERANKAAGGVESASAEIDKMVAAIEVVSFRTNLLALKRRGRSGAGRRKGRRLRGGRR